MLFENEASNVPTAPIIPPNIATGRQPIRSHKDVAIGPDINISPYVIDPTHAEKKLETKIWKIRDEETGKKHQREKELDLYNTF